ncbi:MAG: hypothetical protein HQK59_16325, partial [Deltaproteobacteria bacterium]|nr:hypothetical protein [Deltaproteobacteria bacterium]
APMLSWAVGGPGLLAAYLTGLVWAALGTLSAMVFIMSANVTRDIVKLLRPQTTDKTLLMMGYFLIALFLFLPFIWTLNKPPALLAIFMGLSAMGLGAIFFFVTVVSYYWKRATKWGAISAVVFGTIATLYGGWAVLDQKVLGMGTMEWILVAGCGILYFGVSLCTKPPSKELIAKLFPEKGSASA